MHIIDVYMQGYKHTHTHTHIDSETTICKVRHFIMQGVVKRKEDHQDVKMYFGLTVKKGKMDAYTENVLYYRFVKKDNFYEIRPRRGQIP